MQHPPTASIFVRATAALALACAACAGDAESPPPQSPPSPPPADVPTVAPTTTPAEPAEAHHPPAISGGTLLVMRDGRTAVVADPDFDRVYFVDLQTPRILRVVSLRSDDEPGRLVEDDEGYIRVALRRGGAVATIDPDKGVVTARDPVCPAPRGLAWDGRRHTLHVACAGGELMSIPSKGGITRRALRLAPDLRDVVVVGDRLWVSRFRAAEVLVVGPEGAVERTMHPAWGTNGSVSTVAWRMVPYGNGAVMVHQRAGVTPPTPSPMPVYYNPNPACEVGMTPAEVTVFRPDAIPVTSPSIRNVVLPVDVAVGSAEVAPHFNVISAGNATSGPRLVEVPAAASRDSGSCTGSPSEGEYGGRQAVAVAVDPSGVVIVQLREPPALYVQHNNVTIPLSDEQRNDSGHALFHAATPLRIACASCHPDGSDDGHAWRLSGTGLRRTPNLRGGVTATAPFHWDGSFPDLRHLVDDVFVSRMGGAAVSPSRLTALSQWLDSLSLPGVSPPVDPAAVARGEVVFRRPDVGCTGCHSGPMLTDNRTVDVGTGAAFQVPSLRGLGGRAPYMHDGCAATVRDRFGRCGGGEAHGHTQHLGPSELDDLVAWLESL